MTAEQTFRHFPEQLRFQPVVVNGDHLERRDAFLTCAMGGSAHPSALMQMVDPALDMLVHRDYGLPVLPAGDLERRLVLAVSFSGNTEEPVDAYHRARERGLPLAVVAQGGELIALAEADAVPYVKIPGEGIQPRYGMGLTIRAVLALMRHDALLLELAGAADALDVAAAEHAGDELGVALRTTVPIFYTSRRNGYLGYVWKIKINEGAKVPAYHDVFPELNHNEMQGYDVLESTRELSSRLSIVMLRDENDDQRVQKRMDVTRDLYRNRGITVIELPLTGETAWQRVLGSLAVADWTSLSLARHYGSNPDAVPLVEEFKQRIV